MSDDNQEVTTDETHAHQIQPNLKPVWISIAAVASLSLWALISSHQATSSLEKFSTALGPVYLDYLNNKDRYTVDFTATEVQDVGNGFYLVRAEQEEHLTGLKYKGRIVNTTSVQRSNVEFKLIVGAHEKEFMINQISPGNSTAFDVYLPDVTPEAGRYGEIRHQQSSVSYSIR
ncbi:hypothetical protein [Alcanivorax sp. 1008]|uniref:hypothetical protein n=1 Tax=Alcanivorax sp. 1008 TaxID=2816853 RepID=UPI001D5DF698|nr:hypothetical protein [Alcanivorax sp. 1008]MCC1496865.1 hypothetical protein [Alcanivorax sp. 1008]